MSPLLFFYIITQYPPAAKGWFSKICIFSRKTQPFVAIGFPFGIALTYLVFTNRLCICVQLWYFILKHFNTANIIPSTLSVATSFIAVYLTFRRSPYFALAYAANDVVLIVLWTLAAVEDISYLSVIICFILFLVNDLYGFVSWKRM